MQHASAKVMVGHRDFIKNMITGASQADVALIMVPADGNFTTAIAKGNHKAGEIQGQTRQHSRLINLLGVKQICIGVNKMDCDTAGYKQAHGIGMKQTSRTGIKNNIKTPAGTNKYQNSECCKLQYFQPANTHKLLFLSGQEGRKAGRQE